MQARLPQQCGGLFLCSAAAKTQKINIRSAGFALPPKAALLRHLAGAYRQQKNRSTHAATPSLAGDGSGGCFRSLATKYDLLLRFSQAKNKQSATKMIFCCRFLLRGSRPAEQLRQSPTGFCLRPSAGLLSGRAAAAGSEERSKKNFFRRLALFGSLPLIILPSFFPPRGRRKRRASPTAAAGTGESHRKTSLSTALFPCKNCTKKE